MDIPLPSSRVVVNVVDWETPFIDGTRCEGHVHTFAAGDAPAATVAAHVSLARNVLATTFLCRKCADTIGEEVRTS